MTGDDSRDRALDAMLRTRRTAAPAGGACLDAETLAEWADGTLTADALVRAEAHTADCARCQEAMAALVASQPAPEPRLAPSPAPAASPWWHVDVRWLMPLAGAATAVLVWSLRPETDPTRSVVVEEKRDVVAGERETGVPEGLNSVAKPQGAAGAEAPALGASPNAARVSPDPTLREPAAAAPPAPAQESAKRADGAANTAKRERSAPAAPARPSTGSLDTRERSESAPLADSTARAAPSPPPVAAQTFLADASGEIASAAPSVRWRLTGRGGVERSTDDGATWTALAIDGSPALLAGSAPAATVCWVVGAGGTIRLTIDARAWRPVESPTTDDLVAVAASSEQAATIRSRNGTPFRTVDGGRTWTPLR